MQMLLGIILGIFLTIAGAYVIDSLNAGPAPTTTTAGTTATIPAPASEDRRPMVNWDVVSRNWHDFTAHVRAGWHRLTG